MSFIDITVPDDGKVYWIRGIALPPGSYHIDSGWQSHQGWVEVEKGLPEEGKDVLATYGSDSIIEIAMYTNGHWYCAIDSFDRIVTHWMYLPDKPIKA